MGAVVLADHQCARSIPVDPVYDPRPQLPVYPGEIPLAMEQHGVDQSMLLMPGGRVHHHPLGLVDDQQMRVLVKDVQRDIFRHDRSRADRGDLHTDHIPRLQAVTGPDRPVIDQDHPILEQSLDAGAGQIHPLQ